MIIKNCLVIPTYNNPLSLKELVLKCLSETPFPILIVDDGSTIHVQDILGYELIDHFRIHLIRHEINQGKGMAIQSAISYCLKKGFTHLTTIDGDGQHYPKDVMKLMKEVKEDPFALIIGRRKFQDEAHVPGISHFGRSFSNFWVKYQTGISITDSQSGLRVYPLYSIQDMSFLTKRYDFEIEILVRCLWKNISLREVDIDVFYPPKEERVSHFRKFRDNLKISLLNILLVTLTLLKSGDSSFKISLALGLGIFIGCTPFFGLHALIAIPFALFLRLNYPLIFLGTQISIPPMIPFLVSTSILIGNYFTEKNFLNYLTGSLILGTLLGSFLFLTLYSFLKISSLKGKKKKEWNGKIRGGIGTPFLIFIIKKFGIKPAYFLLNFIAPYFIFFAPKARKALHQYLKNINPKLSFFKRTLKIIYHFKVFGQMIMDRIHQSYKDQAIFKIKRVGHDFIFNTKKSIFFIGAHQGAWDISSYYLNKLNLNNKFYLLQYQAENQDLKGMMKHEDKKRHNIIFLDPSKSPILKIKEIVHEGHFIGAMGDRITSKHIELIPFLGKLAIFDTSIFRIALSLNTPISYIFSAKTSNDEYLFQTSSLISIDEEKTKPPYLNIYARELLEDYVRNLEDFIKKYPEQWFNFYSFWSISAEYKKRENYLLEELNKQ